MPSITVQNLATGAERIYEGITPREAVIAAYAQAECKDYNTGDYAARYSSLVQEGHYCYGLGNWTALKTNWQELLAESGKEP